MDQKTQVESNAASKNTTTDDKKIIISVKRGVFRSDDPEKEHSDKAFQAQRKMVLEESNFTCHYCNFKAPKYQEVHHIDDNHSHNERSNLRTACCLCHAPFHIGFSGLKRKGGIIYLEGVSQANLNILVRTAWIAQDGDDEPLKIIANKILEQLKQLESVAERQLTSSPTKLSVHLLNLTDEVYSKRAERLEGYLFYPYKDGFAEQLKYWKENIYNQTPPSTWEAIIKSIDF